MTMSIHGNDLDDDLLQETEKLDDENLHDDSLSLSGDEGIEKTKKHDAKLREEKLQSDIFILRKLNASFAAFNDALKDTGSANERVAAQLEQTDALLNRYIAILSKSEEFARLIFDEQWQGADSDEGIIERERIEAEERRRRELAEQALIAQRERDRLEREEQERIEKEEKERIEKERRERSTARGSRGVRGTRASSTRGVKTTTRGSGLARSSSTSGGTLPPVAGSSRVKPPTSSSGVRPSATGSSARGTTKRG